MIGGEPQDASIKWNWAHNSSNKTTANFINYVLNQWRTATPRESERLKDGEHLGKQLKLNAAHLNFDSIDRFVFAFDDLVRLLCAYFSVCFGVGWRMAEMVRLRYTSSGTAKRNVFVLDGKVALCVTDSKNYNKPGFRPTLPFSNTVIDTFLIPYLVFLLPLRTKISQIYLARNHSDPDEVLRVLQQVRKQKQKKKNEKKTKKSEKLILFFLKDGFYVVVSSGQGRNGYISQYSTRVIYADF